MDYVKIVQYAVAEQAMFVNFQREQYGYDVLTDMWLQFSTAEQISYAYIHDTYSRVIEENLTNFAHLLELMSVLKFKVSQHQERFDRDHTKLRELKTAETYHKIERQAFAKCCKQLEGTPLYATFYAIAI